LVAKDVVVAVCEWWFFALVVRFGDVVNRHVNAGLKLVERWVACEEVFNTFSVFLLLSSRLRPGPVGPPRGLAHQASGTAGFFTVALPFLTSPPLLFIVVFIQFCCTAFLSRHTLAIGACANADNKTQSR
jgi:hypothetical protein